jgi:outer membrane protein assembly factor BamB
MKTLVRITFLLVVCHCACSAPGGGRSDQELVGTAVAQIARVPAGVGCVQIAAAGAALTVTRNFDVTPGQSSMLSLSKLPTGQVTFSGSAFDAHCVGVAETGGPSWVADPATTTITAGVTGNVTLNFHANGNENVCVNFDDGTDAGCTPIDGGTDGGTPAIASVLQFHNHANRDGFFVDHALTKAGVATLHPDTTFGGTISGNVFTSPLYVANGPGQQGAFYVATESNTVYAISEATGALLWSRTLGTPVQSGGTPCGNIFPLGVTGTPAIDLASRTLVLDAAVGNAMGVLQTHMAFGLSIDDGTTKWSLDLSTVKDPAMNPFTPGVENQRGAVLITDTVAYFVYGSFFGDCGSFRGWVIGVPLTGNAASVRAFRTQAPGGGIWGPGGAASDGTSVFVTTGNASPSVATWSQNEGALRLGADLSFTNTSPDFFAPSNFTALDNGDLDFGGSGPLVIDAPSLTPSALLLGAGKDGNVYLLNRTNLGGVGGATVATAHVASGPFIQAGAWASTPSGTFAVLRSTATGAACPSGTSGNLITVKLDPTAMPPISTVWCASEGSGSPIITTSDGTNDAMVWTVDVGGSNLLRSWDLVTGAPVFTGGMAPVSGARPYSSPIAANGRLVVAGDGHLVAFHP